jgi:hypothetical protein
MKANAFAALLISSIGSLRARALPTSRSATDYFQAGHQHEDRESTWSDYSTDNQVSCRSGHRIKTANQRPQPRLRFPNDAAERNRQAAAMAGIAQ